jgi:hypothetical protein
VQERLRDEAIVAQQLRYLVLDVLHELGRVGLGPVRAHGVGDHLAPHLLDRATNEDTLHQ